MYIKWSQNVPKLIQIFDYFHKIVTKEDGRYVIINQDGRSIPLKVMNVQKDVPEPKKYIVKSKCIFQLESIKKLTYIIYV